jgi:hypothetical protein
LANRASENQWLRKFANFFSVGQDASNHPYDKHKNRLFDKKKYKNIPRDISKRETRDSSSTSTQKFKHSAPQKKTCLPGEGKDREKDPHSHIGSCCLNGAWFYNCSG